MPLRGGESVGQAYVRIYATGDEVPGDIRRILNDAEPSVREAGKEHGEAYSKSFKTEFGKGKNEMFHDLDDGLRDSLARLDLADDFFKSPAWRRFVDRVAEDFPNEMQAAARLAIKRMEAEFRDTGNLEALPQRMHRIGVDVRRAQKDILDALYEDAYRENKAFDARIKAISQERDLAFRESVKDNQAAIIQFRNNMREVANEVEKLEKGQSKFGHRRLQQMVDDLRRLAPNLDLSAHQIDLFNDRLNVMDRHLDRTNPRISLMHHRISDLGDGMGRLFGKGSRNNFLNFLGSFVAMLIKFPTKILSSIAEGITNFGRSISDAFTKAGGGGAGVLAGAAQGFIALGGAIANAGVAIVAFVAFIGFLSLVIGPIVALISGLVGIIVALASSLAFASASLIAFLPLIIPLAGIIAGVVAAVIGLKDATGPLADQLAHIKDQAKGLWDSFKEGVTDSVGLGRVLDEVSRALAGMDPLIDAAIKGFNRFADQIADEMQGGAFDKFTDRFARFLPHAMKDLGDIFASTFGGLAGVLRGAIPSANRLLDWLVDIADRFDDWANSKKGQREIKDFLEKAGDSAAALGDFLDEAWGWLKKILDGGKDSGDNILHNMAKDFEKWGQWLEDHPDALKDWFKNAEDTAEKIGNIIESFNKLIDALDSPRNREIGGGILDFFNDFLTGSVIFIDAFDRLTSFVTNAVGDTLGGVQTVLTTLGKAVWYVIGGKWVGDLISGISVGLEAAGGEIAGAFQDFFSGIGKAFSGGGGGAMTINTTGIVGPLLALPGRAQDAVEGMIRPFRGLAGRVSSAAGDIAGRVISRVSGLPGRAAGIVDQVVNRFSGLAGRINKAVGDIWSAISGRFVTLPIQAVGIAARIVSAFVGLGARIVAAIGNIVIHPTIDWPDLTPGAVAKRASGTITNGPELAIIGEAGREAVVPLDRPLSQVDPAVRWLSAIAQGMVPGGVGGTGKVVDASGWQIVTPSENPWIVATEVVNQLIAKAV